MRFPLMVRVNENSGMLPPAIELMADMGKLIEDAV